MSKIILDGNTACARIAYKLSDCTCIYPITPSSTMAEVCDKLASEKQKNMFGNVVNCVEMQSEAGAIGALHGALSAGTLATTFTSSQGLLLMIPNMFKIAGELKPCVIHVAARTVAGHALSIFGDHSDVMAVRQTGFAMLSSASVQEAQDLALISHIATLNSSVPFVHFFDGFRTSHEINTIYDLSDSVIKKMLPLNKIEEFKLSGLNSCNPYVQGTAQNPDVYFQNKEAANVFYNAVPQIVDETMKNFYKLTKRKYELFEFYGDKKAEHIIVVMGSAASTVKHTVKFLNKTENAKLGVVCVKLYRPFSTTHFIKSLPKSVKTISVLDRTREFGSVGEPLYADVLQALYESGKTKIKTFGGVYGLASKEFTPAMVKAVFNNATSTSCKQHFTIGINDDVTFRSLPYENFNLNTNCTACKFYGYGGDGTVSANKSSIKIIKELTGLNAQAFFEYDSKKSGNTTISHLRFGKDDVDYSYLPTKVQFVSCNNDVYLNKFNIYSNIAENGILLINSELSENEINNLIPLEHKEYIVKNKIKTYVINAYEIADKLGLGSKINLIMQSAFFKLMNIANLNDCVKLLKIYAEETYGNKGKDVVEKNIKAIDLGVSTIKEIKINLTAAKLSPCGNSCANCSSKTCSYYKNFISPIQNMQGNNLPVSAFNAQGKVPTGTSALEKRGISHILPVWKSENCIQCGLCALACPHAAIRPYLLNINLLSKHPESLQSLPATAEPKFNYVIAVSPEDCTGCGVCAQVCPAKNKALVMQNATSIRQTLNDNYNFVETQKHEESAIFKSNTPKGLSFKKPYFEFSGACAGCGETPYIKILSQLFGDRMVIANATGCSSIYGASSPTTPYTKNEKGEGIAWANSLFEDNAEFGLGIKLGIKVKENNLANALNKLKKLNLSENLNLLLNKFFECENAEIKKELKPKILNEINKHKQNINEKLFNEINTLKDYFVPQSVWIVGGDGWAYDIGFGGLDHVLASGENVNILVLDTEVYSNTGGQASKATPIGATAKFATLGKSKRKKELGLIAKTYKDVYIAQVSLGANPMQLITALTEAENYNGVSLIIAYAPCINHGINMSDSNLEMKRAVDSGYWHLWRYNPALIGTKNPFILDSFKPTLKFEDFINGENRFRILEKTNASIAKNLFKIARNNAKEKFEELEKLSKN